MGKGTGNREQGIRNRVFGKWKLPARRSLGVGGVIGNSRQSRGGFTFMELIIVIAIIGILSTLFVTTYPATQRRARDSERRSDIKQYQTAMEAYANRNNGNYAASLGGGVQSLSEYCTTNLGVATCPNDPQNSYSIFSTTSIYSLWATLEQPPGTVTYFVVCSNGRSYETATAPTAVAPCP